MLFEDLSLSKSIQRAVFEQGYLEATPIQEQAIPIVLSGRDMIGCAQTGTGKTAAFAIPIIHQLHRIVGSSKKTSPIRALIITPTRELAVQIGQNFDQYGKYTNLVQLTIFGGVSQVPQVEMLKKGIDILIATPGRLLDLVKQGFIDLDHLHTLVLDEADQMLDMGFVNDVKKIVKLTPDNRQTLLFSATMPTAIRELAEMFLKDPATVTVSPVSSTAENVEQRIYFVEKGEKRNLLYHLIKNENLSNVLVFSRTKHGADNVVKALRKHDIAAEAIHGDKSQNARQRVLDGFKNKEINVLVATDIAARGIDIENLPCVINFALPETINDFTHRVGRTARAGNDGVAITLLSVRDYKLMAEIEKELLLKIPRVELEGFTTKEKKPRTKIREKKSIKDKKFDSKQRESKDKTKSKKPNKTKFRKTTKRG